jgi:hypothetical protein
MPGSTVGSFRSIQIIASGLGREKTPLGMMARGDGHRFRPELLPQALIAAKSNPDKYLGGSTERTCSYIEKQEASCCSAFGDTLPSLSEASGKSRLSDAVRNTIIELLFALSDGRPSPASPQRLLWLPDNCCPQQDLRRDGSRHLVRRLLSDFPRRRSAGPCFSTARQSISSSKKQKRR